MKLKTEFIPDEIFYSDLLQDATKLIFIYLMSTCDERGVCHGQTSKGIEDKNWLGLRSVQMHLKYLLEFKLIEKVKDKDGNIVPKLTIDSKGNVKVPSSFKKDCVLIPSKKFKLLLDMWNKTYETTVSYSVDLYKLYLERCKNLSEEDILKAAKNRYQSIAKSSEYKDPSKSYYRNSLKHFLRDDESVSVWVNTDATGEADLRKFDFY